MRKQTGGKYAGNHQVTRSACRVGTCHRIFIRAECSLSQHLRLATEAGSGFHGEVEWHSEHAAASLPFISRFTVES